MKLNEIQDLIKFVAKSGVSEVEIEDDGFKIIIKTPDKNKGAKQQEQATVIQAPMPAQPVPAQAATSQPAQPSRAEVTQNADDNPDEKYETIRSPMIGTFYRKASPDKPAFINVGDEVKEGDTVCIIEAMKLFNEIEAEISGKIVKVLVDDNSPVEYDQPLFLVDSK